MFQLFIARVMTKMNLQPEEQAPSASLITYTANLLHTGKDGQIFLNTTS